MTIQPLDDSRLAAIRAGDLTQKLNDMAQVCYASASIKMGDTLSGAAETICALLSRLDKAEGRDRKEATFEVHQEGMAVAMASGPREQALAEAMRYAAGYIQDGPIELIELVPVPLPPPPAGA